MTNEDLAAKLAGRHYNRDFECPAWVNGRGCLCGASERKLKISQALAAAERRGMEKMRERAAQIMDDIRRMGE